MPWKAGPASVTPRCSGQSPASDEQLVGPDHHDRVVVLDRDLEVVEVVLLEQRRLPDRRLDERLGRRLAVLLEQPRVERAGVDTDPDRDAGVLGGGRDLADLVVELADVAGVHANCRAAGVDRREDVLRLEMDVGDHRDLRVLGDLPQRIGVVLGRAGHPHDVAAGRGQLGDLLQRRVDVCGDVVVIDCTDIGASPPTSTFPTLIWRVLRRGASTSGGRSAFPGRWWSCGCLSCS